MLCASTTTDSIAGSNPIRGSAFVRRGRIDTSAKVFAAVVGLAFLAHTAKADDFLGTVTPTDANAIRTWTSSDGSKTQKAAFIRAADGYVYVRTTNGSVAKVQISLLSDADKDYVKSRERDLTDTLFEISSDNESTMPPTTPQPPRENAVGQGGFIGVSVSAGKELVRAKVRNGVGIDKGVYVNEVINGSPAAEAGLREGDLITEFDDKPLSSTYESLKTCVDRALIGSLHKINVVRNGEHHSLIIKVGQLPPEASGDKDVARVWSRLVSLDQQRTEELDAATKENDMSAQGQAFRNHFDTLSSLDTSRCPDDFRQAWAEYILAEKLVCDKMESVTQPIGVFSRIFVAGATAGASVASELAEVESIKKSKSDAFIRLKLIAMKHGMIFEGNNE